MRLHEEDSMGDLGDRAYAQELLNIQTWYNQEIKRLNDTLAKKRSDATVKYQSRAMSTKTTTAKQPQQQTQPQQPQPAGNKVDTAGNPVPESINILRVKKLNEARIGGFGDKDYDAIWDKMSRQTRHNILRKAFGEGFELYLPMAASYEAGTIPLKSNLGPESYEKIGRIIDGMHIRENASNHKTIKVITFGGKTHEYTDADIQGFIDNISFDLGSDNLPKWLFVKTPPHLRYSKRKRLVLDSLEKILNSEEDVVIDVRSYIREGAYDKTQIDPEELQSLKDYLDAENVSYIESDEDIEFDDTDVDDEWIQRLPEKFDDDTNDILTVFDEDDDMASKNEKIDEEKVFYVKVDDENEEFIGKIYKLFNDGEWRSKLTDGISETFEKLNFDPDWDEIDIIAFLRENYADAEIIDEPEFNDHVEESVNESYEWRVNAGDKLVATQPTRIFIERISGANTPFEEDSNTGKIPKDRAIDPSWKGCYYVIQPGEVFSFRVSNDWDLSHFTLANGAGFKIETGEPMSWITRHNIKKSDLKEGVIHNIMPPLDEYLSEG